MDYELEPVQAIWRNQVQFEKYRQVNTAISRLGVLKQSRA